MSIKAIIWNNDGVLVDTEKLYFLATQEVLASVGVQLTEAMYFQLFIVEAREAWHLAEKRGLSAAQVASLRGCRDETYRKLIKQECRPLPGVGETLRTLHSYFRMAVVTRCLSDEFATVHKCTGLLPLFEFVVTREGYDKCTPDPEPYLCAVERFGLGGEKCLVIEDSERGVRAAKAAGLACWAVPQSLSRHGSLAGADAVFGNISEVARELDRLLLY